MLILIDKYVQERVAFGDFSGRSPDVIRSVLRGFVAHAGQSDAGLVTRRHVELWLMRPEFRTLKTRRTSLSKLRGFAEWLVDIEVIPRSFCAGVRIKADTVVRPPRFLEVDEVRSVVALAATTRDRLVMLLAVHMGLRRAEIQAIRVEDIAVEKRGLHIRGKGGRGERTRYSDVPAECWAVLCEVLIESPQGAGPLIRSTQTGGVLHLSQLTKLTSRAMRAAGVKHAPYDGKSLHAFRHSCAQHLLDDGKEIRDVQSVMGHAAQATTELYLRRAREVDRDVIDGRSYA